MEEFKKILREFVAIKSVTAETEGVLKALKYLSNYLSESGLKVQVVKGYGNQIVLAKTKYDPSLQTVLVYGHYDVQPASPDFFEIKERKGVLFGRGTADNKGQILIYLYSVLELLKNKRLNFNVTFLIEGNEETGSPDLKKFIKDYKKALECDCILISDSELAPGNKPAIEESFRGAANFEVTLSTGGRELHSGIFGGVAPNAAEELCKIIAKFTQLTGAKTGFILGTPKYEKRRGLGETVEITGLTSGFVNQGFKNSIPCIAMAKINVRSAPDKDPVALANKVKQFLLKQAPKYVKIKFGESEAGRGAKLDLKNKFAIRAQEILKDVYGIKPVTKNSGGTLPIADELKRILKAPQVMIPLGDADCGAHSDTEHISLSVIQKGLLFSSRFFSK